jgi:hypothetical protein
MDQMGTIVLTGVDGRCNAKIFAMETTNTNKGPADPKTGWQVPAARGIAALARSGDGETNWGVSGKQKRQSNGIPANLPSPFGLWLRHAIGISLFVTTTGELGGNPRALRRLATLGVQRINALEHFPRAGFAVQPPIHGGLVNAQSLR